MSSFGIQLLSLVVVSVFAGGPVLLYRFWRGRDPWQVISDEHFVQAADRQHTAHMTGDAYGTYGDYPPTLVGAEVNR